jgi:hypothetical protein
VVLDDDFQPRALADGGNAVRRSNKTGAHTMNTGDPRLLATLAFAGPGIPGGRDLGVVDNGTAARIALARLGYPHAARPNEPRLSELFERTDRT